MRATGRCWRRSKIRTVETGVHVQHANVYILDMDAIRGFDWDDGNVSKVETRGFTVADVERAFLNGRGTYFPDLRRSETEERHWLIGLTDDGRHVTVPFTIRTDRIRPITAWTTARKYRKWVR